MTEKEVFKLAKRLEALLEDARLSFDKTKSRVSCSTYFEIGTIKVRISDHGDFGDADISVDPDRGCTFDEMLSFLKDNGVDLASKPKKIAKKISDEEFEGWFLNVFGSNCDHMRENIRARAYKHRLGFITY